MGAEPLKIDIFVEIDYMQQERQVNCDSSGDCQQVNYRPDPDVLEKIISAFESEMFILSIFIEITYTLRPRLPPFFFVPS